MKEILFNWKGSGNTPSVCRIFKYENNDTTVVIASPMGNGTAIAHGIELLAPQVLEYFNLDSALFVEHDPQWRYDRRRGVYIERYELITFEGADFKQPEWKVIPKEELESLVGSMLPSPLVSVTL